MNKLKDKIKCIFGKHTLENIWIRDRIYDAENDNDDLKDFPTINKISYCAKCGKIISIEYDPYAFKEFGDINKFERICKVNAREITLYKENY